MANMSIQFYVDPICGKRRYFHVDIESFPAIKIKNEPCYLLMLSVDPFYEQETSLCGIVSVAVDYYYKIKRTFGIEPQILTTVCESWTDQYIGPQRYKKKTPDQIRDDFYSLLKNTIKKEESDV